MERISTNTINRVFIFFLLIFLMSIIFIVSKYIGFIDLLMKIIGSLVPVFIAIFVSFILEPLIGFFLNRGIKRKYSVFLVYGLLIGLIILVLIITMPSFTNQIKSFIKNVPELIDILISFFYKLGVSINESKINYFLNGILMAILKYISSSITIIFNIILGISGALFLSIDFPEFRINFKRKIPKSIKKPTIYYFHNFLPFIHKYFIGMLIDSIFIFLISLVGFLIIDIDYMLVLALFVSLTNLIPIIGPYIGGIPAVIVGFSASSNLGISALIVVVIVQLIESNIVQPLILKNVIKLHPLEGILGISLFGTLFGVVGMILSPILIVAIKMLFIPYNEKE